MVEEKKQAAVEKNPIAAGNKPVAAEKKQPPAAAEKKLIAVVRVRGWFGMNPRRRDTLEMLNIPRSNNCTLIHASPSYEGMLHDVKDYATWGAVSEKTVVHMIAKRATVHGKRLSLVKKQADFEKMAKELLAGKTPAEIGIDRTFKLTPPSGGWKGKKQTRPKGDLGARPSMDVLLAKMI